jgi:hypothetical protein
MLRRALVLALLGATFGTLFDWAHVRTGAIGYPRPDMFGIAWWVPLLYTCASLAIGLSHPIADRLLGRRPRFPHTRARLAVGFFGLCAIWFASGALPFSTMVVSAFLAPAALALWWTLDRTWQGLLAAVATAIVGFAVEVVLSRAGFFHHTHPDVLGIAVWLPWIYVAASVGLGNVGRWLAGEEIGSPEAASRGREAGVGLTPG